MTFSTRCTHVKYSSCFGLLRLYSGKLCVTCLMGETQIQEKHVALSLEQREKLCCQLHYLCILFPVCGRVRAPLDWILSKHQTCSTLPTTCTDWLVSAASYERTQAAIKDGREFDNMKSAQELIVVYSINKKTFFFFCSPSWLPLAGKWVTWCVSSLIYFETFWNEKALTS